MAAEVRALRRVLLNRVVSVNQSADLSQVISHQLGSRGVDSLGLETFVELKVLPVWGLECSPRVSFLGFWKSFIFDFSNFLLDLCLVLNVLVYMFGEVVENVQVLFVQQRLVRLIRNFADFLLYWPAIFGEHRLKDELLTTLSYFLIHLLQVSRCELRLAFRFLHRFQRHEVVNRFFETVDAYALVNE